jgi:hypothetical protein
MSRAEADRPIGRAALPNANGENPSSPLLRDLRSPETAARHPILIPVPVAAQGETSFHPRYNQPKRRLRKDGGRFDDWGGGLSCHLPSKLDEDGQLNRLVPRAWRRKMAALFSFLFFLFFFPFSFQLICMVAYPTFGFGEQRVGNGNEQHNDF